jgi:hypothetical protein
MIYSAKISNKTKDLKILLGGIRGMKQATREAAKFAGLAIAGGFGAAAGGSAYGAMEGLVLGKNAEMKAEAGNVTGNTTAPGTDSVSQKVEVSSNFGSSSTEMPIDGASAKVVAQSPSLPNWGIFDLLNPVYWGHSPFLLETSMDLMVVVFVLTMVCVIVILSIMWSSYWSSTYASFLFGKKKLAIYHLALISLFIVLVLVCLALLYIGTFAHLRNDLIGLQTAKINIVALEVKVSELTDLVDKLSKN